MTVFPSTRQLEAFLQVAQFHSFRQAAEALNLSQPALSQAIVQLEQYVDTPLFNRTTRSVSLTPAGRLLLTRLEKILPDLRDALATVRDLAKDVNSQLRIGFVFSAVRLFLPEALTLYRQANPQIRIIAMDGTADQLYAAVQNDELDFALTSYVPFPSADVVFESALVDRIRAVMRRDHPLAARSHVTWDDLLQNAFIGLASGSAIRHAIDTALADRVPSGRPAMEFTQLATISNMVEVGLGVTALPALCCPRDHPVLCSRTLTEPDVKREIGFVVQRNRKFPKHVATFRALMERQIADYVGTVVPYDG